ncbi:glyoxalase III HchA [Flammeovirga pacifica]|uniref:Protein deglycase HchA n=1 Tax=Flammeovirga pacifica TaxID=915059 RepID=A0A1S1YUV7_FLAPC|nr:glyoxalase III HchA [Flammeovirga pacifica]OHX64653.1 protein deglycase HchA [Flammeovirga pacifica]
MLRKLLGLAPKLEQDGSYSPSKIALKFSVSEKTNYEEINYQKYEGSKTKILVIFTEQKNMVMKNGKLFSTGNHPVEALLPMLHLQKAGFEFEVATPKGLPVVFEMWAYPEKDQHVNAIYNELKSSFENPIKLKDFIDTSFDDTDHYAGVFIPGGHGAMLGIPDDENVGKILRWANKSDLFTITLCNGPGSLLATTIGDREFLYKGYKMCVFPDSVDRQTPMIGYLPGHMPRGLSETLSNLGATLMNTKFDDSVCVDRKLITGASPLSSNNLGKLAAETLLKELK